MSLLSLSLLRYSALNQTRIRYIMVCASASLRHAFYQTSPRPNTISYKTDCCIGKPHAHVNICRRELCYSSLAGIRTHHSLKRVSHCSSQTQKWQRKKTYSKYCQENISVIRIHKAKQALQETASALASSLASLSVAVTAAGETAAPRTAGCKARATVMYLRDTLFWFGFLGGVRW